MAKKEEAGSDKGRSMKQEAGSEKKERSMKQEAGSEKTGFIPALKGLMAEFFSVPEGEVGEARSDKDGSMKQEAGSEETGFIPASGFGLPASAFAAAMGDGATGNSSACRPGLEFLIMEGARLKGEIDAALGRLRKINVQLAESARFEGGKKTAYINGAGYKVKVSLVENTSWDQEKLRKLKEFMPDGKFAELFKTVYEPTSKKEIDGFLAHGDPDFANGVRWCMSVKPGSPQVSYEKVKQEA
jgi:hypothetical protein